MAFDVDKALAAAMRCELLDENQIRVLCERLKDVLETESNVKALAPPVTVVGDVHGQFYDILELFRVAGPIPDTNYLFMGDYVDRGPHSVETITLLACLKLKYPERVTLLRGNHESRQITQVYGFYVECVRKYSSQSVWQSFTDMFDYLPIAAVIGSSILAVHGGLSPSVHALDQVRILDRFAEIPHEGPIADLMWSDPDPEKQGFVVSPRGAGYVFGYDVARRFLWLNSLDHIVRAHQLCMSGYQLLFKDECMSTVWSAPNYCYRFGNAASVLEVNEDLQRTYNLFDQNPDYRPPPPPSARDRVDNYFV
jgi:serine/threonine-protein phosphatase PPG1